MATETAVPAKAVLEAYKRAVEAKDYEGIGAVYAEDAVMTAYSERNRPSSAEEVRGAAAIRATFEDTASSNLEHTVSDELSAGDRIAFKLVCRYPSGELVVGLNICDVVDGKIARQTVVEAWDE